MWKIHNQTNLKKLFSFKKGKPMIGLEIPESNYASAMTDINKLVLLC